MCQRLWSILDGKVCKEKSLVPKAWAWGKPFPHFLCLGVDDTACNVVNSCGPSNWRTTVGAHTRFHKSEDLPQKAFFSNGGLTLFPRMSVGCWFGE